MQNKSLFFRIFQDERQSFKTLAIPFCSCYAHIVSNSGINFCSAKKFPAIYLHVFKQTISKKTGLNILVLMNKKKQILCSSIKKH